MALSSFHPDPERLQKRWIFGALGLAMLAHVGVAGIFGWYKIPGLEVPFEHSTKVGPFTVKHIEINPETGTLNQKASMAGIVFLIILFAVKFAAQTGTQAFHVNVAVLTDALAALALGMFTVTRVEM